MVFKVNFNRNNMRDYSCLEFLKSFHMPYQTLASLASCYYALYLSGKSEDVAKWHTVIEGYHAKYSEGYATLGKASYQGIYVKVSSENLLYKALAGIMTRYPYGKKEYVTHAIWFFEEKIKESQMFSSGKEEYV